MNVKWRSRHRARSKTAKKSELPRRVDLRSRSTRVQRSQPARARPPALLRSEDAILNHQEAIVPTRHLSPKPDPSSNGKVRPTIRCAAWRQQVRGGARATSCSRVGGKCGVLNASKLIGDFRRALDPVELAFGPTAPDATRLRGSVCGFDAPVRARHLASHAGDDRFTTPATSAVAL